MCFKGVLKQPWTDTSTSTKVKEKTQGCHEINAVDGSEMRKKTVGR